VANDAPEPGFVDEAKARAKLLLWPVGVVWAVNLVNSLLGHGLDRFGVVPRSLGGLLGILAAPFLHASWGHLLHNTISFLMIGWILMLRNRRDVYLVGGLAALTAGLGTWLVGVDHSVHLGASGVVFGLLGYLLSRGVFERKIWPILGTLVGLFFFAGSLRGLFPGVPGISWEGHLCGFLGGILAAWWSARRTSPARPATAAPRARIAAPAPRARVAAPAPAAREAEPSVDEELEALRRKMSR
jgi:membrane associated rhomboid family serine protease